MNKAIHRIAGLIMAIVMILGNIINTKAVGRAYYVSPTGNDANPGTASAPFKTFAKANSVLTPGSTLYIYAGIYKQPLKITKSGTSTEQITVQPLGGKAVIDLQYRAIPGVEIRASYVTVKGLVVRKIRDVCVNLKGANLTVSELVISGCTSHGISVNHSVQIRILNSRVSRAVQSNHSRTLTSGWGSGIKVRLSKNVLIQGNTIYHNFGEGIGTRGTNIIIRGNTVFDNYSVNIYTNSQNVSIERNFVYCTPNSGYERNGLPAVGISLAEEYFAGWGARLKNARVLNNIVAFCKNGIRYAGADEAVLGGGLKSATIAYNTLYGSTNAALSIVYESAQSGSMIANNIIWQMQNNLTAIDNPTGLTFQNNLWKVAPPAAFRGPGDQYGDPEFAGTPAYTPESYRLSSSSPAIRAGADTGIFQDFYAKPRGPEFDIGAIQFTDPVTVSPTPTLIEPTNTLSLATAQVTPSPTPVSEQPTSASMPDTSALVLSTASPTIPAQPAQPSQEIVYDNTYCFPLF